MTFIGCKLPPMIHFVHQMHQNCRVNFLVVLISSDISQLIQLAQIMLKTLVLIFYVDKKIIYKTLMSASEHQNIKAENIHDTNKKFIFNFHIVYNMKKKYFKDH